MVITALTIHGTALITVRASQQLGEEASLAGITIPSLTISLAAMLINAAGEQRPPVLIASLSFLLPYQWL